SVELALQGVDLGMEVLDLVLLIVSGTGVEVGAQASRELRGSVCELGELVAELWGQMSAQAGLGLHEGIEDAALAAQDGRECRLERARGRRHIVRVNRNQALRLPLQGRQEVSFAGLGEARNLDV